MKFLRVTMPDGTKWDVPAHIIARSRAHEMAMSNLAAEAHLSYQEVYQREFDYTLASRMLLFDWAANNMDWKDVQSHAIHVPTEASPADYQEGWMNGKKEVVEHE